MSLGSPSNAHLHERVSLLCNPLSDGPSLAASDASVSKQRHVRATTLVMITSIQSALFGTCNLDAEAGLCCNCVQTVLHAQQGCAIATICKCDI